MMSKNKGFTIFLILALCGIFCGIFFSNYILINGSVFARDATCVVLDRDDLLNVKKLHRFTQLEMLDLREVSISVSDYEALCEEFPDCDICWRVPFQNEYFDNTITELCITKFCEDDINVLQYFPKLDTVDARGCSNYDALMKLRNDRPDLNVMYEVRFGDGQLLRENATECSVTNENCQYLTNMIPYLPELSTVNSRNCTDYETLMNLQQDWPDLELNYAVIINDTVCDGKATEMLLAISDAQDALEKLQYFPNLSKVTFSGIATDLNLMYQLMCRYSEIAISWDFELFGVTTNSTATELILNNILMDSVDIVEDSLKYFYDLQWVEMCQCGISNEDMDALWKRHPETRFVWAITMGCEGIIRTDTKAFIPFKYGYNIDLPFYDGEAEKLKYLVDLECLDLGHMRMSDVSFLQYMPKLKYLILADTVCKDFSYIADLTELVYLELFRSEFQDVSLLMNLTKLEDLNIGWTNLKNGELLKEMTWLKRLWTNMNGMSRSELADLKKSLPNTLVYIDSIHPTEGGWRESQRYYEMRDMLGMFYMK